MAPNPFPTTTTTTKRPLSPTDPDTPPPPPAVLRQQSLASYASVGASSSLGDMEADVEGMAMSFLTYPEALSLALTSKGLHARWPSLRDGLESIALDPTGPNPHFTPSKVFGPLLQSRKKPTSPMRRLRRLLVRGAPVAIVDAESVWGFSHTAEAWRLTPTVLRGLRLLFPRLVELDLAGCRLGMQGATELAKGVKQAGGWPCLRRIDLRHNLLNSAAFTRLAEAFCALPPTTTTTTTPTSTDRRRGGRGGRRNHRRCSAHDDDDDSEQDEGVRPPPPCCPPPRLEEICLENNVIGPEAFTGAIRARLPPTLRRLNLRDNHIGDAGTTALAALLGDGSAAFCNDDYGSGAEPMEAVEGDQCPVLEELCLGYNDVGPVGLRALAAALRSGHLSHLTRLELSGNNLVEGETPPPDVDAAQWPALFPFVEEGGGDERAMLAFAGALEADVCPHLRVLELDDTDMTDAGLAAVARALKHGHCPHLTELNLGGGSNYLQGPGLDALGEALAAQQGPKKLERLSLDGCEDLREEAITRFLATALITNPTSTTNSTPPATPDKSSTTTAVAALSSTTTTFALSAMQELSLRGLQVSDDGARAIAAAIARGGLPALRRLSLDFTDVTDQGILPLVQALGARPCPCPHLESLRLRCSLVGNAGVHALAVLLLQQYEGDTASIPLPALKEVDMGSTSIINSERLRRTKLRLRRARPGLVFIYESV